MKHLCFHECKSSPGIAVLLEEMLAFWNEICLMCNECCAQVWEMLAPTTRWTAANQARRATELSAC